MPENRPGSPARERGLVSGCVQPGRYDDSRRWASPAWPSSRCAGSRCSASTRRATDISGYEVEWTPDGESLVVGDIAGVVSVWDADTGQHLRGDITHPTGIVGVDISPDGSTVASASNNLVLISNLETGDASYNLDRGGLTDISFSSDGSRVVVIDKFGTALVIDPKRRRAVKAVTATGMTLVTRRRRPDGTSAGGHDYRSW